MDDLLQGLVSMGHGTHTRNSPDGAAADPQGAVFEATFDALKTGEPVGMGLDGAAESAAPTLAIGDHEKQFAESDGPLTLPPNEIDQDNDGHPMPIALGDLGPSRRGPPSATSVAINAQVADARPGASRHGVARTTVEVGPHTLPTAEFDPDQRQHPAPPVLGGMRRLVPAAEGPNTPPTDGSHSLPMGRAQLGGELGEIRKQQNLAQPLTIPPNNRKEQQPLPLTIPPADPRSELTQPTTSPTSLSSDRVHPQSQPLTIPPADRAGPQGLPFIHLTGASTLRTDIGALASSGLMVPPGRTGIGNLMPPATVAVPAGAPNPLQPMAQSGTQLEPVTLTSSGSTAEVTTEQVNSVQPPVAGRTPGAHRLGNGASQPTLAIPQLSRTAPPAPADSIPQDASSGHDILPARTGGWTTAPTSQAAPFVASLVSAAPHPLSLAMTALSDMVTDALPDVDVLLQPALAAMPTTALTPAAAVIAQAPSATAQVIAQQIAATLTNPARDADAPLELALDPPELGRVRMQISEVAGTMTLMIQAERPETADLMRRHLELLAQEFAQAGLNAPSVHIGQEGADDGGRAAQQEASDPSSVLSAEPEIEGSRPLPQRTAAGGLDLRL